MFSNKTKRYILRIIPFGLIWLAFGVIYLLLEKGLLGDLDHYPSTGNPYDFESTIFISLVFIPLFGLLIGAIEILYLDKLFSNKSFGKKILLKSIVYLLLLVVFLLASTVITTSKKLQLGLLDPLVWDYVWNFFVSYAFWSVELYIMAIVIVSLFFSEVSEYLGLKVLYNFFVGRYHQAVEEERIFMFLDMKSSTTIAEKLGHVKYFELLRSYYEDLTDPIIFWEGEIYQYVGDEIIITWKLTGGSANINCVKCFFDMKRSLADRSRKYEELFGVTPTFKAGLHYGKATTGEIGVIKKEIIFTGDVLNATARIQGLCNSLDVDLLLSEHLMSKLDLDESYQVRAMGKSELKGRNEAIDLFTILEQEDPAEAN